MSKIKKYAEDTLGENWEQYLNINYDELAEDAIRTCEEDS